VITRGLKLTNIAEPDFEEHFLAFLAAFAVANSQEVCYATALAIDIVRPFSSPSQLGFPACPYIKPELHTSHDTFHNKDLGALDTDTHRLKVRGCG
jgi:hypothetical protein